MEEKTSDFKEETTSLVNEEERTSLISMEGMSLEETQTAEQLYNSAGLDPVVEAGLKDYDRRLQRESRLLNKVFGARGSDIQGYGETVAKRVALAIYGQLNKQYGGRVGDMRSYIMTLEDERNRANEKYDELMGRVVGILGNEYRDLRTDSAVFMEKLTTVVGEDLKEVRIDQKELTERLGDIDGLRSHIAALEKEKEQLREEYELRVASQKIEHDGETEDLRAQIAGVNTEKEKLREEHESHTAAQKNEHGKETRGLKSRIARLDSTVEGLESEKEALTGELAQLREVCAQFKTATETLDAAIPYEEMRDRLGEELYAFILKDSRVPDAVVEGVGKFIDFKKYLAMAVERGARETQKRTEEVLGAISQAPDVSSQ
ncbi:MAG TPA: hypothetical protein VMW13_05765 [Dehalococcoidales bacterium]|nr:hypothetical protein [Dehalococcoidales bacterium]